MIPKKFSKILTTSILPLLMASAIIPIAHASDDEAPPTGGPLKKVLRDKKASTSASQSFDPTSSTVAIPLRRTVSAPEPASDRRRLLTEEPIPAPSIMVRRSPSIPRRVEERQAAQDIGAALLDDDLSPILVPLSQPVAGFVPLSGHQHSQFDDSNTEAAIARLSHDTMKDHILPQVERLLAHTWDKQPAATLSIKDDLVAVVEQLKAGKPQEASVLSTALIDKVNIAEKDGPLDEFSRVGLYSVQTVLHLLAGTPYIALNNFLELRQLGISWDSSSLLVDKLFRKGRFYQYLTGFVSSDQADSIWAGDDRIRKLWQGHAQFAWDQNEFRKISEDLGGLGNLAGLEGQLTFLHTCYVLGKMQLRFGEHSYGVTAASLLRAAHETLAKIDGYHFEGLFSYRNVATRVFLGDIAWGMHKLENPSAHLHEALIHYRDALPLIIADNETGAAMIRSSFNHTKGVIEAYSTLPDDVVSKAGKIAQLVLFKAQLDPLLMLPSTPSHIDASGIAEILQTTLDKLAAPSAVAVSSPKDGTAAAAATRKKSDKKRKGRGDDEECAQRHDDEESQFYGGEDYLDLRYAEYQQPPEPPVKKR